MIFCFHQNNLYLYPKYKCSLYNHFFLNCFLTQCLENSNFVKTLHCIHGDDYNMAECFELALSLSREGHMHQSIVYHWPTTALFTPLSANEMPGFPYMTPPQTADRIGLARLFTKTSKQCRKLLCNRRFHHISFKIESMLLQFNYLTQKICLNLTKDSISRQIPLRGGDHRSDSPFLCFGPVPVRWTSQQRHTGGSGRIQLHLRILYII